MIRLVSFAGLALLVLVAFALYDGVAQVQTQQQQLRALAKDLARETEGLRVLKAEWTYLNQPERLQELVRRHLSLAPTRVSQITTLDMVALREKASKTDLHMTARR